MLHQKGTLKLVTEIAGRANGPKMQESLSPPMEAREIPEETYYHVPRMQEVAVFGQAAALLPDDRPAFRRRWVTQPVTFTCVQCQTG